MKVKCVNCKLRNIDIKLFTKIICKCDHDNHTIDDDEKEIECNNFELKIIDEKEKKRQEYEVFKFRMMYTSMNNPKTDYLLIKVMLELNQMLIGYVCTKWYKTTKKGTKANFVLANEEQIDKRLEEIKSIDVKNSAKELIDFIKGNKHEIN